MVFEVFRRRQKTMMVILAVLAMFAFVFAGAFDQLAQRSQQGSANQTLAVAWGDEITAQQVFELQQDRNTVNSFVMRARVAVGEQPFELARSDEAAVIEGIVLREKAKRMGISVTNKDVNDFIADITLNKLGRTDFFNILNGAGENSSPLGVSESELFRILGQELVIGRVTEVLVPPVLMDTPLEIWREIEPTLTNVQLEVAKIPVEDFTGKAPEPTDADLQEVYDRYKSVTGNLADGVPGLLQPQRVNIEYVTASLDEIAKTVAVTEEEAKKYFEEHKDEFLLKPASDLTAPGLPTIDSGLPVVPPPPPPVPPTEPEPKPEEAPKAEPKPEAESEPKPEEKPAEPSAPPKTEAEAPKEEAKPVEEKPAPDKKDEAFLPGIRSLLQSSLVSVTLLAQEEEKKAPEADKANPAPAEEKKAEAPAVETKTEEKKAEAPAAAETKEAEPKESETPAVKADTKETDAPAEGKAAATDEPKPQYEPFEEVREQIVQRLTSEKAKQKAFDMLAKIRSTTMEGYKDRYIVARSRYRETAKRDETGKVDFSAFNPPTPPDLSVVAKQHGFEYGKTGLATREDVGLEAGLQGSTELTGDADVPSSTFREVVFNQSEFRGRIFEDSVGKKVFLTWKIEDQPETVPSLESVRDQVVRIWKLQKAKPLAEEKAKEFAEKIKAEQGDMTKGLKESPYTYVTTGLFPKVQSFQASMFGGPMQVPTTIPEIPNAGMEFLDKVFELKVGDIEVLPDQTETNYYVVKVKDKTDPDFTRFTQEYNLQMVLIRNPAFLARMRQQSRSQSMFSYMQQYDIQAQQALNDVMQEANLRIETPANAPVEQEKVEL